MGKGEFDNIREKLYDVQMPADAGIWDGIESTMRKRRIRKVFLYACSAAAVLIAALFVFRTNPQEPHISSIAAQLPVVQQTNEKTSAVPEQPAQQETDLPVVPASHKGTIKASGPTEPACAETGTKAETAQPAAAVPAAAPATGEEDTANSNGRQEHKNTRTLLDLSGTGEYVAGISERKKREYAITVSSGVIPGSSASVSGGIIKASSAGAGSISQSYSIEQISDTRYSLPLNLGIQFLFPIGNNMALGTGIGYTMLRSRYDCLINKKKFSVKQTLHYIGIPVNVYGLVVDRNNFSFYVNAGATLEKGIRAVYDLRSYNESEHNSTGIDGLQFSVNAGMGVEYRLGNTVGVYLEPNIVYYIDSNVPQSIRTDQPLQVKAELGFRFRF